MGIITIILVLLIAFVAGMGGILDQFQFHQPIVACTLIGLAFEISGKQGALRGCIILGGTLQLIAMGWANIGAAVAPDAALASVASAILLCIGGKYDNQDIQTTIGIAILLATAGLVLTMVVRTLSVAIVHGADKAAANGDIKGVERFHLFALLFQGLRIAIPAGLLLVIPATAIEGALGAIPEWFSSGMAIGGGMVVAVGYAMLINLMATKEVWPFFFLGFAIAAINSLTLIALGMIGLSIAFIYVNLSNNKGSSTQSADPLDEILNDY